LGRKDLERPYCDEEWTNAKFTTFVKNQLRAASMKWPPKNKVMAEARVSRGVYLCNCCKQHVPYTVPEKGKSGRVRNIQVNHKVPVSVPNGWDGWDNWINRLFCDSSGLEVLCTNCHDKHTAMLKSLKEEWRDIKDNNNYQISNFGRVRHKVNGLRKLVKDTHYYRVKFWSFKEQRYKFPNVHRLVAEAFLPNPNNLPEVNHKDGYKLNNYLFNLEWCSRAENARHASENNLMPTGEKHHAHKGMWETPYGIFPSLAQAAEVVPFNTTKIFRLCKNPLVEEYKFIEKESKNNNDL
jgi:hypothetical protein